MALSFEGKSIFKRLYYPFYLKRNESKRRKVKRELASGIGVCKIKCVSFNMHAYMRIRSMIGRNFRLVSVSRSIEEVGNEIFVP
jgi:hypothetical protein